MHLIFCSTAILGILAVVQNGLAIIRSPGPLEKEEDEVAKFQWNSTKGKILDVRWGLALGNLPNPLFISVEFGSAPRFSDDLNGSASSYTGRVSFFGNLSAGHAWFKITNLTVNDSALYIATIREQGTLVKSPFSAKLTVLKTTVIAPTPTLSTSPVPSSSHSPSSNLTTTKLPPTTPVPKEIKLWLIIVIVLIVIIVSGTAILICCYCFCPKYLKDCCNRFCCWCPCCPCSPCSPCCSCKTEVLGSSEEQGNEMKSKPSSAEK